jgi:hypothetical protein
MRSHTHTNVHATQGGIYENSFIHQARKRIGDLGKADTKPPTLAAVVKGLYKKLAEMEQHLREDKARFKDGEPIRMNVNVKPRGPIGVDGPPGTAIFFSFY